MRRTAKTVLLGVMAAAACVAASAARAQVVISSAPIQAKPLHTHPAKPIKGKFQVMHMLPNFIQVRSVANATEIHDFTYSDAIRPQMQQILDQGGYQYGDKVTIEYWPDKQVAVKIKGKHSKPS